MIQVKNNSILLLLLVISGLSLQTITPTTNIGSSFILENDVVYLDLQKYFNLANVKYPVTATGSGGITPYLYDNAYDSYKYVNPDPATGGLNFVKILNEDFVMFVYAKNKVLI